MSNRSIELEATLRLALEALTATMSTHGFRDAIDEAHDKAITAIKEALSTKCVAQPAAVVEPHIAEQHKQEPVAFIDINKLELKAEEAECVAMCLNDRGVQTHEGDKDLSLWGRVEQYAKPRFLDGMTTNAPSVSDEHIKECAKVTGLIGNWSTAEVNDRIVGFARVLLGNPAVQEAFLKANTHLLYTTPPQPKEPEPEPTPEWMTEEEQTAYTFGWFKALEKNNVSR